MPGSLRILQSDFFILTSLGDGAFFRKRAHCFVLSVKHLKHGHQLGDLEQLADAVGQIRQLDGAADAAGGSKEADQSAQAAAVDIVHVRKVDDDVLLGFEMFLDGLAQHERLVAEDDAAVAVHDGDTVNQARV